MRLIIRTFLFDDIHKADVFTSFDDAVEFCEKEFNLSVTDRAWREVVASRDLNQLHRFLYYYGIDVELRD